MHSALFSCIGLFLHGCYLIVLDIIFLQWTLFFCISHNFLALIIIFVHWTLFSCIEYYFLALDIIFLHWILFSCIGHYFLALDIIFLTLHLTRSRYYNLSRLGAILRRVSSSVISTIVCVRGSI